MSNALHEIRLRRDILNMEQIVKSFSGSLPSPEIRENITLLINNVCVFKVTDRTSPEDIDKGEFRYGISPTHIQEEVIIKFM